MLARIVVSVFVVTNYLATIEISSASQATCADFAFIRSSTKWNKLSVGITNLPSTKIPQKLPYTTINNDDSKRKNIILLSKSKKSGGGAGGASTSAASKKIQVKLLKYVDGTGHVGEIIQVTPAFFQNKLRPTKSAIIISDEEVQKEKAEAIAAEKKRDEEATAIKTIIDETTITLKRKTGPDGQLFGGIGAKTIMDEVIKRFDNNNGYQEFLYQKSVKVSSIEDDNSTALKGDIKHTGTFTAKITLTKDIIAKLVIEVIPEL